MGKTNPELSETGINGINNSARDTPPNHLTLNKNQYKKELKLTQSGQSMFFSYLIYVTFFDLGRF